MKKILFRADAKPSIGIGDLMSLINISYYFENWEKFFVIRNYKAGVELAKKRNVKNLHILDEDISIEDEVEYLNNFIFSKKIDTIFLEITERKLEEYQNITDTVKKVAVNFDGYIPDNLDLVIDWDVEAENYFDKEKYPNTKFLLGAKYVILPKEFYSEKIAKRKFRNIPKKVLIAMGGADELNFTQKIVEVILKSNLDLELNIIIGSGYEYRESLEKILEDGKLEFQIQENIINMLDEYLNCDIAIGAGGLTSSELIASKTPAILIATYKHQIARCIYFDKVGWAKYLGYRNFSEDELIFALQNPIKIDGENPFQTEVIVDEVEKIFQ